MEREKKEQLQLIIEFYTHSQFYITKDPLYLPLKRNFGIGRCSLFQFGVAFVEQNFTEYRAVTALKGNERDGDERKY